MQSSLKKVSIISFLSFLLLCVASFPWMEKDKVLRTNFELEEVSHIDMNTVYLLNANGYLTEVSVFIGKTSLEDEVLKIFELLKETTPEENFSGYLPKKIEVLNVLKVDDVLYVVLNDEAKGLSDEAVSGVVHSLLAIKGVRKVSIQIGTAEPKLYDKSYPINRVIHFVERKNISKVVVYYLDEDRKHFVPVTKYENNSDDKISIIIEELKENVPDHLVSYFNTHTKLLDYREENNMMILNFSSDLVSDKSCEEDIINSICYSVFHNYDVGSVSIEIDGTPYKLVGDD